MPLFKLPEQDIWRDIPGYEKLYMVNRNGEVMRVGGSVVRKDGASQSYPSKILKPYEGQVYLSKGSKVATLRVCDIVAQAFIDDYHPGDKVYHISGPSDALSNLSLVPPLNESKEDEEWKFVPGTNDLYQVSIHGEVRSVDRTTTFNRMGRLLTRVHRGKVLSQELSKDGYMHCMICIDGVSSLRSVHRLVALAHIPNPENKPDVNHIDGNKMNNDVTNLEWVTQSENAQHAIKHNLWDPVAIGHKVRQTVGKPVICITDNEKRFDSINSAALYYGMDFESVKESIRLNRPRKGYVFKYADKCEVSE